MPEHEQPPARRQRSRFERARTRPSGEQQHGPDHERGGEHLPVDGVPAERTFVDWRRTPQRRPEAGKTRAACDASDELEEQEHVYQVGEQRGAEEVLRSRAEELV